MRHRRQRSPLKSSTANLGAEMFARMVATGVFAIGLGQGVALAQVKATEPIIVVSADGKLAAPWVEKRVCPTRGPTTCRDLIINPATREIAKLDDQWTSKFKATGNGLEVRRAESERDKAVRLKGQS